MDCNGSPMPDDVLWILIAGFIIAFFLAFGVGANDVANSFGTSVGSKVLTIKQACIMATIFEVLGAVTLGYKVSSTIRTGMINTTIYEGEEKLLMIGYLSSLIGGTFWNLVATFIGLPISGTHSIVGAIVGFSIVAKGFKSVNLRKLYEIAASWIISPLSSGLISIGIFVVISLFILKKEKPLEPGLRSLPLFYSFTIFINIFSIAHDGPEYFPKFTWWQVLLIAFGVSLIVGLAVWFFVVPRQRKTIHKKLNSGTLNNTNATPLKSVVVYRNGEKENLKKDPNDNNQVGEATENSTVQKEEVKIEHEKVSFIENDPSQDKPEVAHLFSYLQILTACFGAFAHGANDVSNAIGPLVSILLIYQHGHQNCTTPWYILLYGGIGISVGLWVWGRKVIKTMGQDLTKITPSSGFSIEIGAASTVLLASKIGFPISTTHCKVGSVVMVGRLRAKENVDWSLFTNIIIAWILTVPISALCSAGAQALLQFAV